MLQANPEIITAAIWQRLADQHGTTVACPTLRAHLTSRRSGSNPHVRAAAH